jgi:hypothetical protein
VLPMVVSRDSIGSSGGHGIRSHRGSGAVASVEGPLVGG